MPPFLPGQAPKVVYHRNGKGRGKKKYTPVNRWGDHNIDPAFGAEYTTRTGGSRYWQPKVDERDDFGQVTVYDGTGQVIRVIPKEALKRPWRAKDGVKWSIRL